MKQNLFSTQNLKCMLLFGVVFSVILGCNGREQKYSEFAFNGATMGTTYHITVVGDSIGSVERSSIATSVDSLLNSFNQILSTYEEHSEISRFNRLETIQPVSVSDELLHVVKVGQALCISTGGAFDITVMPIVNFFGFGFEPGENRFPTINEIDSWLDLTGCDKLDVNGSTLTKSDPRISIDLSAIAKGDASDHVIDFLEAKGYKNLFVEIGGEIMTRGVNKYGKTWKIGIDRPTFGGAPGADLQHIIQITDEAVATSGDYRNYREVEGQRISHMFDPRTGTPIEHNLAAVTIITNSCMLADGLATSVMVLGPKEGLTWLENYPEAEGLLIVREAEGVYKEYMTSGFKAYLAD